MTSTWTRSEQALIKLFGPLSSQPGAPARPVYPVPDHDETLVAEAKDKELPATSVGVFYKLPRRGDAVPKRDYRRHVVEAHLPRHGERAPGGADPRRRSAVPGRRLDHPAVGARSKDVFMQLAATKQDGVVRGLEALTREVERVDRHGFTPGELGRARTDLLRGLEQVVREKDKTPSAGTPTRCCATSCARRRCPASTPSWR